MPIFLVTPLSNNAQKIKEAILEKLPSGDCFELPNNAGWLVSSNATSMEVSNLLEITPSDPEVKAGLRGSAIVTLVGSYYGRGPTIMWEWLKTRIEGQR